jgi:hypothetical protein
MNADRIEHDPSLIACRYGVWFKVGYESFLLPEIKRTQRPFAGRVPLRVCDGFCRLCCTRSTQCEQPGLLLAPFNVEGCAF